MKLENEKLVSELACLYIHLTTLEKWNHTNFYFLTLKAMQELGYPQPQSYSLAVWGQWCHHNFLSSSSWALFQQRSPRPASHTVYPEGPVPKPDTLRGVSAPCLRSSLKWTLGSLDWHLQQELMSLRTMEDQGGQLGGESGSAWPGPNLPAVADTYSLGFFSHVCPDTIEAAASLLTS